MNDTAIFWLQLLLSCVVCALVAKWYVWPRLTKLSLNSALVPPIFVHVFRYVGMVLLVTGMVDPKLPREALSAAAYGDLLAAALALASIFALRGGWRFAIPLVWVFSIWGFVDLLNTLRGVVQTNLPSFNLGPAYFIYTFYAPTVVVAHLMIFWILLRSKLWNNGVAEGPGSVAEAKAKG
ncbi:hypothetical protein [Mycobacterium sp. AT1]|uniref:hypothetical protein n=1 Tax=Mycobacterium sp. AT1 TaxID=1961706 RepID=UPI0009ADE38D|nr:hypothetical protein [Mycobacterium sp. AT1]OPX07730.1 hypothetical protein B1790_21800 [Mycobacterium sp. AT1]